MPAAVLAAPVVWTQVRAGRALALLADPGPVRAGAQASADAAGRMWLATGFPTSDAGGWTDIVERLWPGAPTWWLPLLLAPVALAAIAAATTRRWPAGLACLAVALVGIVTAFAAVGIAVSTTDASAVPLWPGAALSLTWLGIVGAAVVTGDAVRAPRLRPICAACAVVAVLGAATLAAAPLTSLARGTTVLVNAPASTLPAYVAAEGRDDPTVGTLVLTPVADGGVAPEVVWGDGEVLGGHSTIDDTARAATAADLETAELTADVVTTTSQDVVARLAGRGIQFVLIAADTGADSDAARRFRLAAETALNQRAGVDFVGDTARGLLWRVTEPVTPRAADSPSAQRTARWIAAAQLAAVGVAVLLAVPKAASRRAARRTPRIVGRLIGADR